MNAVNPATTLALSLFREKAKTMPLEEHPYSALLKAREKLEVDNWPADKWPDDVKEAAMSGLCAWVANILAASASSTMNEIVALMRIANEGDEKAKVAVKDMHGSMPFLEQVITCFLNAIDIEHVAEKLFEDGVAAYAAQASGQPVSDAPKPEPKQIQNWTSTRWNPSLN